MLLNRDVYLQVSKAALVGMLAKVVSVISVLVVAFVFILATDLQFANIFIPSNGNVEGTAYKWSYSIVQLLNALVVAPFVETLVILVIYLLSRKLPFQNIFYIIFVLTFAFFAHGMGVRGWVAVPAFFVLALYFVYLAKRVSMNRTYNLSVLAHVASNATAIIFSFVR